ncbi:frequency clock protein-domain-containing protein [Tuber brumale]|nr:frequency clock protein-domain-containing protein [Tuber brumale]
MPTIPTQQPFHSSHSHLKHQQQYRQQLLVRPATTSTGILTPQSPLSMSDHPQNPRRKPPEESNTLRRHLEGAMNTARPAHIPHAGDATAQRRKQSTEMSGGREMGASGFANQESGSANPNMDNGFNSGDPGVGMGVPPTGGKKRDAMLGEWRVAVGSSGVPGGSAGFAPVGEPGVSAPTVDVESSGVGSGEVGSTPEDWFNTLNQNVGANNYSTYDDELPYYISNANRKKYLSPGVSCCSRPRLQHLVPGLGFDRKRVHGGSGVLDSNEESNSDSFRSVIDDLTIKSTDLSLNFITTNKKLKKRLKKLEGLQGGNLQEDKLFEVRIHGLSLLKKQELEKLLQGFASTLENNGGEGSSSSKADQLMTPPSQTNPSSRNADSAYASNPRSGSGSVVPSQPKPRSVTTPMSTSSSDKAPRPLPVVSEKHKMKEVVRRLEQLFTGFKSSKMPSPMDYQKSDRGLGRDVPEEGAREAPIMSPSHDGRIAEFGDSIAGSHRRPSDVPVPDQRPTRPIDLDPFLQAPEENFEYLVSLTTSSSKDNTKLEGLGDGWFSLILVAGLAQLHTVNVTIPFVKKAITTVSQKLELSPDGRMVRWKGGYEGTRLSGGSSSGDAASTGMSSDGSPGRWSKSSPESKDLISVDPPSGSGRSSRLSLATPPSMEDKFHYKPLFARSRSFDDDSSSAVSTSLGSCDLLNKRASSDEGTGQSGSSGKRKNLSLDGPIIYYEGGKFCTDLSAQRIDAEGHVVSKPGYNRFTNSPIGERQFGPESPTKLESPLFARAQTAQSSDESMGDGDSDVGLQFSPRFSSSSGPTTPPTPIELEVSGIGGVFPEDNFAINVQTKHYLLPQNSKGALPLSRANASKSRILNLIGHHIPKSSIDVFQKNAPMGDESEGESEEQSEDESGSGSEEGSMEEQSGPGEGSGEELGEEDSEEEPSKQPSRPGKKHPVFPGHKFLRPVIVSAKTLRLPPSQLPPASCIYFPQSDETSSMGSDSGSGVEPQSSSSDEYFRQMINQKNVDIYGNFGDEDFDAGIIAGNGMRIYRPGGNGDVGSSAATAGDASGASSPAGPPADRLAMMTEPQKVNLFGIGETWDDSGDSGSISGDIMSSSAGDEQFGLHSDNRPNLKRGRTSGTPSENAIPVLKKSQKKDKVMTGDMF